MTHEVKYSIVDFRLEETIRNRGLYTLGSQESFDKLLSSLPDLCDLDLVWGVATNIYEHSDIVKLSCTYWCNVADVLFCIVEDILNTATDFVVVY